MSASPLGFPTQPAPVNLGRSVLTRPPAAPGSEAVFPILESGTLALNGQVITLALNEAPQSYRVVPPGNSFLRFGRLRWRVGERQQIADFDLKAGGTVFPLACDWFQLLTVNQDPEAGEITYQASCTLGLAQANLHPPTRTAFNGLIAAITTVGPFNIPQHATAVSVTCDLPNVVAGVPQVLFVQIIGQAGQTLATVRIEGGPSYVGPHALPAGARRFNVINASATNIATTSVIFDLAF